LYKNLDRVRIWGHAHPQNVALGYDVGKISLGCLVIPAFLYLQFPRRSMHHTNKSQVVSVFTQGQQFKSTQSPSTPRPPWYNQSHPPPVVTDSLSQNELTVVTAYFDIGEFMKGPFGPMLAASTYRRWLTVFAQIRNPVVAYFDNADHVTLMRVLRQKHPKTRVVLVDRSSLWSFREMEPRIAEIFSRKNYPWNPPNTVVSNYSAAMHAKYELMQRTIRDNPFQTAYICWLDVGLFRDLSSGYAASAIYDNKSFQLALPPRLNSSRVAYTLVFPASPTGPRTAERIVIENSVWVCGCFFIGRVDVMWNWASEYLAAVERMVSENWMSTDQQVIYWLFLGEGKTKLQPTTSLQLYRVDDGSNEWFFLGYLAKKAGEQSRPSPA